MARARILIAATDADLRGTLARWLMGSGYGVELAESPKRAREVIATEPIALAIVALDGLGESGEDVARELGDLVGRLIVIQESADGDDAGAAEGSIAKPLRQDEVLARVGAALPPPASDAADPVPELLRFAGYVMDLGGRVCRDDLGREVPLDQGGVPTLLVARSPASLAGSSRGTSCARAAVGGRGAEGDVIAGVARHARGRACGARSRKSTWAIPGSS